MDPKSTVINNAQGDHSNILDSVDTCMNNISKNPPKHVWPSMKKQKQNNKIKKIKKLTTTTTKQNNKQGFYMFFP